MVICVCNFRKNTYFTYQKTNSIYWKNWPIFDLIDKKAFFIFSLFFLIGISLVLFTDLFTQDGARATFFLQSVTASLAPLAFYITFRNYQRKSGDQFKAIIDMSSTSPFCLTVPSPKQITIQNLKDKPLIIKEISLIIKNNKNISL